eukprot:5018437-Pyramimonas_sp.AAC.1
MPKRSTGLDPLQNLGKLNDLGLFLGRLGGLSWASWAALEASSADSRLGGHLGPPRGPWRPSWPAS